MNKLMGFYELKDSLLPTIPWKRYTGNEFLSDEFLWTIRTAVYTGNDFNLPRFVGVSAKEANENIKRLYDKYKDIGMVIYYPFFVAEKSGTLSVYSDKVIIEAVANDLWNLVTNSDVDITIIKYTHKNYEERIGDKDFLSNEEIYELLVNVPKIRGMFRDFLLEGKNILLEWSFAYNCDINKETVGKKYLVFYEARAIT